MRTFRGAGSLVLAGALILIGTLLYWHFGRQTGSSAPQGAYGLGDAVIAVVDGEAIRAEEWKARVGAVSPEQSRRLLKSEVRRRAVLAVAEDEGYGQREEIRQRLEESIVALYLRESVADRAQAAEVSDAELDAYLAEHPIELPQPLRRAAVLRRGIEAGDDLRSERDLLISAREESLATSSRIAHFGPVAMRVSDHRGSRARGGVLGYFGPERSTHDSLPGPVHAALWSLSEPGEISDVVAADGALYLVRFVDEYIRPGQDLPSQREVVRQRLVTEKREAARQALLEAIESQAGVRISPDWQARPPESNPPPAPPATPVSAATALTENPT